MVRLFACISSILNLPMPINHLEIYIRIDYDIKSAECAGLRVSMIEVRYKIWN